MRRSWSRTKRPEADSAVALHPPVAGAPGNSAAAVSALSAIDQFT